MRIQNNIAALNTAKSLQRNQESTTSNLGKLSSGYGITKASDNASGLAISEKMRGQIRGMKQATKNATDGVNLLQTAEGYMSTANDILQRMRELAVQSANGSYDIDTANNTTAATGDRAKINEEMQQLTDELDRLADTANFNGMKLNGQTFKFQIGADAGGNYTANGASDLAAANESGSLAVRGSNNQVISVSIGGFDSKSLGVNAGNPNATASSTERTLALTTAQAKLASASSAMISRNTIAAAATGYKGTLKNGTAANAWIDSTGAATTAAPTSAAAKLASSQAHVIKTFTTGLNNINKVANGGTDLDIFEDTTTADLGKYKLTATDIEESANNGKLLTRIVDASGNEVDLSKIQQYSKINDIENYNANSVTVDSETLDIINKVISGEYTIQTRSALTKAGGAANASTHADFDHYGEWQDYTEFGTLTGANIAAQTTETQVNSNNNSNDATAAGFRYQLAKDMDDISKKQDAYNAAVNDYNAASADYASALQIQTETTDTIKGIDLTTQSNANKSIDIIDSAISKVTAERARLGAAQNRLDYTIDNLSTAVENTTASESAIRDTDMVDEMMDFTKNNVLNQAATAMMAQANSQTQSVLQLLG